MDGWMKCVLLFDIQNVRSVVSFAVMMCMVIVLTEKSIYASSIEILFMNSKEKKWNEFYMLLFVGTLFTFANGIMICFLTNQERIIFGLVSVIFFMISLIINWLRLAKIRKCKAEIGRLITYYQERLYEVMTIFVVIMVMIFTLFFANAENVWSYAIIGGIVQVIFSMLIITNSGGRHASNYYIENNEKYYIYNRIDTQRFLCGNTPEISNATWYEIVVADKIKERRIYHEIYHPITKQEKKSLWKICKQDLKEQKSQQRKQKKRSRV